MKVLRFTVQSDARTGTPLSAPTPQASAFSHSSGETLYYENGSGSTNVTPLVKRLLDLDVKQAESLEKPVF